jgi:L-rhamnose mutarotase
MAAKWDETVINEGIEKWWTVCGDVIQEAMAALEKAAPSRTIMYKMQKNLYVYSNVLYNATI